MKKELQFLILPFVLIFCSSPKMNAQSGAEWQPIYLQVTGHNTMDGVEALFQLNSCNGEDIISIKYINHNDYAVKLEWFDAVFTQELKWINKEQAGDKKTIQLAAKEEAIGKCSNNLYAELIVKVKDFTADKKDFKRYSASRLRVSGVQ